MLEIRSQAVLIQIKSSPTIWAFFERWTAHRGAALALGLPYLSDAIFASETKRAEQAEQMFRLTVNGPR